MPTAMTVPEVDAAKAEAFAGRFVSALNNGALCLMASIGHRTGLFDVLSTLPPSTSDEIASRARLNERYVREWLGAMVAAGVVAVEGAATLPGDSRRQAETERPKPALPGAGPQPESA